MKGQIANFFMNPKITEFKKSAYSCQSYERIISLVLLYVSQCIKVLLMCVVNDNLHLMTSDRRQRLRVDLADWEGNTTYAEFDNFTVGSAQEKYRLASLGTYSGTGRQYVVEKYIGPTLDSRYISVGLHIPCGPNTKPTHIFCHYLVP